MCSSLHLLLHLASNNKDLKYLSLKQVMQGQIYSKDMWFSHMLLFCKCSTTYFLKGNLQFCHASFSIRFSVPFSTLLCSAVHWGVWGRINPLNWTLRLADTLTRADFGQWMGDTIRKSKGVKESPSHNMLNWCSDYLKLKSLEL